MSELSQGANVCQEGCLEGNPDILFPVCSCFPPRAAGRVTPWSSLAPGTQAYALPVPSADRRLKTKLPAGCSAAWRYHRGKWSMVNTLASSSGVRNFLQGERFGISSQIWEHVYPFLFFHTRLSWLGQEERFISVLVELQVENISP